MVTHLNLLYMQKVAVVNQALQLLWELRLQHSLLQASSGTYATGGGTLTKVAPSTSGTTALTDFADLSFTTATITAMGALIYNSTNSNKAVAVLDFTSNKTSTSGTFTIQFPTADASNAIIRIA